MGWGTRAQRGSSAGRARSWIGCSAGRAGGGAGPAVEQSFAAVARAASSASSACSPREQGPSDRRGQIECDFSVALGKNARVRDLLSDVVEIW